MVFDLIRFLEGQNARSTIHAQFQGALFELRCGKKRTSGWVPSVFPSVLETTSKISTERRGGGSTRNLYTIKSYDEAQAYYTHSVLGPRLQVATQAALDSGQRDALKLFDYTPEDVAQFRSCLTLFANVEQRLGTDRFFRCAALTFWDDFDEETLSTIASFDDYHGPFRGWPHSIEAPVCKLPVTRARRRRTHMHHPTGIQPRRPTERAERWEVKYVLASRVDNRGNLCYQIDWKDGRDDNQWYTAASIKHAAKQLAKYHDENPDQPGPPCRLDMWWRACIKGRLPLSHPDDDKPAVDRFRSGRVRASK